MEVEQEHFDVPEIGGKLKYSNWSGCSTKTGSSSRKRSSFKRFSRC